MNCDGCRVPISLDGSYAIKRTDGGWRYYHETCWLTGWYSGIEPKGEWPLGDPWPEEVGHGASGAARDNDNTGRRSMRVGIDLDGVCYDFAASVREYLCNHEGTHDPAACAEPERWEFYEDWGLDLPAFLDAFHAGVNAGVIFSHGAPWPNVAEAFHRIKENGHSIHIVTDRSMGEPGMSEAATSAWLARHGLPFDSLTFSADKTVVNLDVMVDDKLSNYDALEAAGVRAYLLTRKWNQHDPAPRRRVLDLLHFAEVICND